MTPPAVPPAPQGAAGGPDTFGTRRSIVRGLGWSALAYPLNVGFGFLTQVLAAQLLTQGGFGTFSLATSVFTMGALIAQLGLPQSLLRRASSSLARGDRDEARHEILSAFALGSIGAVVIAVLLGSPLGTELFDAAFPETALAAVAVLVGIRTGLKVLENLVPEALRAFRLFLRVAIFDGLLTNGVLVAVFVVILVGSGHTSTSDLLLASIVVSAVTLIPGFVTVARRLRGGTGVRFAPRNPLEPAMWVSSIGRAVLAQLDLLIVGALASGRDVALYAAPFRLSLLVGFPLIAVNQVVTPLIAGWHVRGETSRLQRTLQSTAGLATLISAGLALVCVIAGGPILRLLFGARYDAAWGVLAILAIGQVLQTAMGSCGFAMMMTGHQTAYATILMVSTALTLPLDVLGYELWGIEGVATATALTLVAQNAVQVWYLRRVAGFTTVADVRSSITEGIAVLRGATGRGGAQDQS